MNFLIALPFATMITIAQMVTLNYASIAAVSSLIK